MSHLILVSHGNFCSELKRSAEMIMGTQKTIHTVPLLPEEGEKEFLEKFEEMTQSLEEFIVFSDLLGGTPCNILSKKIMQGASFELYTGMSLPMVISFVNAQLLGIDGNFIEDAIENTINVNKLLASSTLDSDDE